MELVEGVPFTSFVRPAIQPEEGPTTDYPSPPAVLPETTSRPGPATSWPPVHWERLRHVLKQLAEAVLALHQAGKLHRDIKPNNVLITKTGRAVLLDFGLAVELDQGGLHESTEQHVLGTVGYMAPEQAAGAPLGPACDWYAVGAMLFEAMTGRLPFLGAPLDVLNRKQHLEPPAPRDLEAS
ncbi:MAG: serine/threonine protein kinase, partial [Planctomycetes bacterium]|nr:serine/threonine protein kinase [Planctomycetota bacterium]